MRLRRDAPVALGVGGLCAVAVAAVVALVTAVGTLGVSLFLGALDEADRTDMAAFHPSLSSAAAWIEREPKDPRSHMSMGFARFDRGEYDQAIAELREAQRLQPPGGPFDVELHFYLGKCYVKKGQAADARRELHHVLRLTMGPSGAATGPIAAEANELLDSLGGRAGPR